MPRIHRFLIAIVGVVLFVPVMPAAAQSQLDPGIAPSTTLSAQQATRFDANGNPLLSDLVQQQVRAQGGTKIPILIPYLWTRDAAAAEASGFKIKIVGNNYTAIFRPANAAEPIDIVIEGTMEVVKARSRPARQAREPLPFSSLGELRGGSITFRRNEASYLIQFVCRGDKPMEAPSCIEESDARNFVTYHLTGGTQ
ncbi:MAG: hypothetical protein EP347_04965 [Alphaproteobacteria bacterium]|nr:MAG: hypothetical protein EP347_04965 [Alphaproteobacteria bacterium]